MEDVRAKIHSKVAEDEQLVASLTEDKKKLVEVKQSTSKLHNADIDLSLGTTITNINKSIEETRKRVSQYEPVYNGACDRVEEICKEAIQKVDKDFETRRTNWV